ncbi:hypothetical protein C2S51_029910 [Perilla frutescens var. frutescens]|nr:hypothetical protein C2S51_029910 [Perilla frutescens var. frutescens]
MPSIYEFNLSDTKKSYLFEFRTKFILQRSGGAEVVIDNEERFHACVAEGKASYRNLEILAGYKLDEYRMPDHEIEHLIEDAIDLARQLSSYPEHTSLRVIPVVVSIDVCTVQQEGEDLSAATHRAIRARRNLAINSHVPAVGKINTNGADFRALCAAVAV